MLLLEDVHTEIYFGKVDIIMGEKSGAYHGPFSLSWQHLNLKKKRKRQFMYVIMFVKTIKKVVMLSQYNIEVAAGQLRTQ